MRALRERPLLRIGHGGASGVVAGNTRASFDAALDLGVDVIEFDLRAWQGRLVLAHTVFHAQSGRALSLEGALAHLASPRFAGVGLNVDVKHVGCEAELLDRLRHAAGDEREFDLYAPQVLALDPAPSAPAAAAAPRTGPSPSARPSAASAKTPPASVAVAAPGGTFASTESQSPTTPSAPASATLASCQIRSRRHQSRVVAAGTT
jgi:hypothetical protein